MGEALLMVLPGVVFFALQFFFLRKTERCLIRLIPVGLLALTLVIGAVVLAGSGVFVLVGVVGFVSALIGEVLAWIINWGW